ncbi:polyphosphate polymerase domain-containing protein [Cellulomonas hominis]
MTAAPDGPLARLAPISLVELTEHAGLQTRVDRKYVLPATALTALLADLPADTRVLQIGADRGFGYESVYFDTRDLTSYRLAAHRGRRRFKVRTRTYLESGTCWLEVKTRGARGTTVKQRRPHEPAARAHVGDGRQFVADALAEAGVGDADVLDLVPTLVTRDGALDVNGTLDVSGGVLLAAGSSGMAVSPSADSAQGWISATLDSVQAAGTGHRGAHARRGRHRAGRVRVGQGLPVAGALGGRHRHGGDLHGVRRWRRHRGHGRRDGGEWRPHRDDPGGGAPGGGGNRRP